MSDDTAAVGANDEQPQRSETTLQKDLPGKILQSKRQELNWSVDDVARSLHLAPRQIQALEADNYRALPGIAVSRGFLRSYAKLLKLDPAPLLQMIGTEADVGTAEVSLRRALPDKPFYVDRSLTLSKKSRTWLRGGIWSLLALLIGLSIAWKADWLPPSWTTEIKNFLGGQKADQEGSASSINNDPEQAQIASMVAAPGAPTIQPESLEHASVNRTMPPNASGAIDAQGGVPQNRAIEQAPGTPDNTNTLVLKMREDSWIEVRDTRNKVLLSRLAKAGESEAIPVREPIKLKIGNAAGVDAQLRGVPVELSASAKNNVARLTVN